MKIGFIGLGNMATAMIGGMLQKGIAKPEDIIGSSKTETTAAFPIRRPWYWRAVPVYASEKMSRRMRQSRCFPCSVPSASQVSYRSV